MQDSSKFDTVISSDAHFDFNWGTMLGSNFNPKGFFIDFSKIIAPFSKIAIKQGCSKLGEKFSKIST